MYNHATLASSQDLFAQLWKEYALSDSRYLTSDHFMLCVETITVVSLPTQTSRDPRRMQSIRALNVTNMLQHR